jgi:P22_AR N-terminal domain
VETTLVPFHDDVIEALYEARTSTIYVVCKRVAENLGLEWSAQYQVLRGHELLSQKLLSVDINIEQIGHRETLCLPLKYLPLWLAGIQTKRVRSEIRTKLLLYQEECADVLARYFLGDGVVVNPQEPVKSTMDIIKQMHQEQGLIIQQIDRHNHIAETHSHELARLEESKLDKHEFERHVLQQRGKDTLRRWHAERKFPDWVKEWMWAHAGGRCLNPACRRELDPSPQAPRYKRPQCNLTPRPKVRGICHSSPDQGHLEKATN